MAFWQRKLAAMMLIVVSILLIACQTEKPKPNDFQAQRGFFLEAVQQAQSAGKILQNKPDSQQIKQAMAQLDQAMIDGLSVDKTFLQWLDQGLYQSFSAYFLKGIENYRLGVELADQQQQSQGIRQLQQWWNYWSLQQANIEARLKD